MHIQLLLFLAFTNLSSMIAVQDISISKIEFTTGTRGYQKQVFITQDSVISIVDGRQERNKVVKRKLQPGEWKQLTDAVISVDLRTLSTLQSPTSRRAFDGARTSSLKIIDSKQDEWEHSFDDENPHDSLKKLMDVILGILGEPAVR